MSDTINKKELKEVLASFMLNYHISSRYVAQYYTKIHYREEYYSGKESADFMKMIDSFEDNKEEYIEQLKHYKSQCYALRYCINEIATRFDIEIEHEEVRTEFMQYFENKGYFLPIIYNVFVFKKD